MDIFFILLVIWTFYSIYRNVIKYHDYKYLLVLFVSGIGLYCFIKSRFWWLFWTLLLTNIYYGYIMVQNVRGIWTI